MTAPTVPVPCRPVIGIMAKSNQDGKSSVARLLHEAFGNPKEHAADLEYSDILNEVITGALRRGGFNSFGGFCWRLIESSRALLDIEFLPPGAPDGCDCEQAEHDPKRCPVWNLRTWYETFVGSDPKIQEVDRANKLKHRAAQIYLGIKVRQWVDPGVWAREVARRIEAAWPSRLVTAGGVRFPEDAAVIWKNPDAKDGLVVRVIGRSQQPDDDPTNALNGQVPADVVFWNNTEDPQLLRLAGAVRQFHADWQCGVLQREYGTKKAA